MYISPVNFVALLLARVQSVHVIISESCKSQATITDVWLGGPSSGAKVITVDHGGSNLITEDHHLLVEDQAGKDITSSMYNVTKRWVVMTLC